MREGCKKCIIIHKGTRRIQRRRNFRSDAGDLLQCRRIGLIHIYRHCKDVFFIIRQSLRRQQFFQSRCGIARMLVYGRCCNKRFCDVAAQPGDGVNILVAARRIEIHLVKNREGKQAPGSPRLLDEFGATAGAALSGVAVTTFAGILVQPCAAPGCLERRGTGCRRCTCRRGNKRRRRLG